MNLIAKEYVAARNDKQGVLILSEMAGAIKEMGEAVIINPNHTIELADALNEALDMPKEEQIRRNQIMQKRLQRYDVARWASDFIGGLQALKKDQDERFHAKYLSPDIWQRLVISFRQSNKRIVFLDYDGTLVPFVNDPTMAIPTREILNTIEKLSIASNTDVVIISGRDRKTLDDWFGKFEINMVAEHGVWLREKNNKWHLIKPLINDWKPTIIPLLNLYADRLPGAFVEEKDFSIVWHYRQSDPELSAIRAKELLDELISLTSNIDVQIIPGNKVIEVRNAGINKGVAGKYFLDKGFYNFVMAIGDDWSDEDLFRALPEEAYTVRLGMVASYARFNLYERKEVIALLKDLIGTP
jgi:trehalose 6-phosphate synthase/phosphatase